MMLSDVPADGYCIEIGKQELMLSRGQTLATGQILRNCFSMLAGIIQTVFLNG